MKTGISCELIEISDIIHGDPPGTYCALPPYDPALKGQTVGCCITCQRYTTKEKRNDTEN